MTTPQSDVAEANQALQSAVAIKANTEKRLAEAKTEARELEEAAGEAALLAIAENDDSIWERANEQVVRAESKVRHLTAALEKATERVDEARMAVVRATNAAHVNRVAKLVEQRDVKARKLEKAIAEFAEAYFKLFEANDAIVTGWPYRSPPEGGVVSQSAIWELVEREMYRASAKPDGLGVCKPYSAQILPGAKKNEGATMASQYEEDPNNPGKLRKKPGLPAITDTLLECPAARNVDPRSASNLDPSIA